MHQLERFDRWLFFVINNGTSNPVFDGVLPFLRQPVFWIPLYIFTFLLVFVNFKQRAWGWALCYLATVTLTDIISSRFFKPLIGRIRPCNDAALAAKIHVLAGCGGNGSFTSSHASNHMGMAMFIFMTLYPFIGKRRAGLYFVWAGLVCYAQIYVGVHYPFDILGGLGVGTVCGSFTAWLFNKKMGGFNTTPLV